MEFITQEEAKIKIREWLLAGETDDQIREKLASYDFVDIVITNLLNEIKTKTNNNINNFNPTINTETPPITSEIPSQSLTNTANEQTISSQPPKNIQTTNKSESKLKYILYFLFGFIIPILGLLIGSLMVIIKEKQNKGTKFIVLLIASILSLFFWNMIASGTSFSVSIKGSAFPAIQTVGDDLKSFALDKKIVLSYTKYNQPITLGTTTFSSLLNAKVLSDKNVSLLEISNIGKQICSSLEKIGTDIDAVQVEVIETKFVVFTTSVDTGGSCDEWLSGKVYDDFKK